MRARTHPRCTNARQTVERTTHKNNAQAPRVRHGRVDDFLLLVVDHEAAHGRVLLDRNEGGGAVQVARRASALGRHEHLHAAMNFQFHKAVGNSAAVLLVSGPVPPHVRPSEGSRHAVIMASAAAATQPAKQQARPQRGNNGAYNHHTHTHVDDTIGTRRRRATMTFNNTTSCARRLNNTSTTILADLAELSLTHSLTHRSVVHRVVPARELVRRHGVEAALQRDARRHRQVAFEDVDAGRDVNLTGCQQ